MITKGTTHNSGGKLAHYMVTGKEGERAELWQLRGFAFDDIKEAFRSVHVMAEGTRCLQPFFHVQVRNPEGEALTRPQWEYTANRIEARLGLAGQPRAIAFHTDEKTGHEHMHVAWSRIDEETLTARPLPFFKDRLKKVSRELELHFGLTLVRNTRPDGISYAPTRAEDEQARRLGVNVHEIRQTIRDCYERSDCGRSFESALAEEGMVLAKGDKRDFMVIDPAGGMHALGKRILDVSAAQIRQRLDDLDREQLPTVDQARNAVRGLQPNRESAQAELAWDRDRYDKAWNDAVAKAAIEQEKIERRFVEPKQPSRGHREEVLGVSGRRGMPQELQGGAAPELGRVAGEIRLAYSLTQTNQEFANALEDRGFILACVTEKDAERLNRWDRQRSKEEWQAPVPFAAKEREKEPDYDRYKAGDLAVVTDKAQVQPLTQANTGDGRKDRAEHLKDIDRAALLSVTDAENVMRGAQHQQKEEREQEHALKHEDILREAAEEHWPTRPPQPERKSPGLFGQAAEAASRDARVEDLNGPAAQVWKLWTRIDIEKHAAKIGKRERFSVATDAKAFAAALDEKGFGFAVATKEEAERSHREASFARAAGNYASRFKEGEILLVTAPRPEYRRDGQIIEPPRVHKIDQSLAEKFTAALGNRRELKGIEATKLVLVERARERAGQWEAIRLKNATKNKRRAGGRSSIPTAPNLAKAGSGIISGGLGILGKLGDGLSLDALTPKEKYEAAKRDHRNEREADKNADYASYLAELSQARQENERQNAQHQKREPERERDR